MFSVAAVLSAEADPAGVAVQCTLIVEYSANHRSLERMLLKLLLEGVKVSGHDNSSL
jgi:hypothetical protein